MKFSFHTVDVFTDRPFGGNPLAVVLDADALDSVSMQAIAREFGYAETTFVCQPQKSSHTARVRIFTPANEIPFAGHPNVGTAFVLASPSRETLQELVFEETAGLVPVRVLRDPSGSVTGAELTAPEALTTGSSLPGATAAALLGLDEADIVGGRHDPIVASIGLPFLVVELRSRSALTRARPVIEALERYLPRPETDAIYLYTRDVAAADGEVDLSARMFAPWDGVAEDPATGSATGAAAALMLTRAQTPDGPTRLTFAQGIDMGRPSRLEVTVEMRDGQAAKVRVGGRCASVMSGTLQA
jgi:trans-2,3-dihydro-3-hydroxyanthranilate isomerase